MGPQVGAAVEVVDAVVELALVRAAIVVEGDAVAVPPADALRLGARGRLRGRALHRVDLLLVALDRPPARPHRPGVSLGRV